MKLLYPVSNQVSKLTKLQLAIKIARHSSCNDCSSCPGLRPPTSVQVALDEPQQDTSLGDLTQYGSDDDEGSDNYLQICNCGHDTATHGADESAIGRTEFLRKARVAIRLDELLEDAGRLLDFDYSDEDIEGLRRQMTLPDSATSPASHRLSSIERQILSPASSVLSDITQPPSKRRRISVSSGLSSSSSSDDEDRPLAKRLSTQHPNMDRTARKVGRKSGKQVPAKKSSTAPALLPPPSEEEQTAMNNQVNGVNGRDSKVKIEDTMDEGQLDRLATGVTVDSGGATGSTPTNKKEKVAHAELRKGVIRVTPVQNDNQERSLVILTNLKTLFQKQLPKMPREYIARLVYDYNSRCMAIIKRGYKVVGGICYRPFEQRGFAEIVFFATASVDQVKGYGGMLMDHFKAHIRETYPNMSHFLTYADNYAVGYFKKQGFSKEITLPRSVWAGYIKDYEGGTIMQCTMVRKVDYLNFRETLARQQEAVMTKIREMSKSHIVYPGLPQFSDGSVERVDPQDVPGLKESGWTPSMITMNVRPSAKSAEFNTMRKLLSDLQAHPLSWAFNAPVNRDDVTDYYDIIKNPMDFGTIEHKLDTNQYPDMAALVADAQLVFDNCKTYNPENTVYHKNAIKLDKFMKEWLADRVKKEEPS